MLRWEAQIPRVPIVLQNTFYCSFSERIDWKKIENPYCGVVVYCESVVFLSHVCLQKRTTVSLLFALYLQTDTFFNFLCLSLIILNFILLSIVFFYGFYGSIILRNFQKID